MLKRLARFSRTRFLLLISLAILVSLAVVLVWDYLQRDQLTEQHGPEMEAALNHYFLVRQDEAAFRDPERYCSEIATGDERKYCITVHMIDSSQQDVNRVLRLRVIDYQERCSIVMATFSTAGSTLTQAFHLDKEDGTWKVAERVGATGAFNANPSQVPISCGK